MTKLRVLSIFAYVLFYSGIINTGYEVGDYVTDFKLKNVDGNYISMSADRNNKGYIIVFTCNTCPWANLNEKRVIALHNKYASRGFPVIAIQPNDPIRSPGDSFEEMKARSKKYSYPFPYVIDKTQEVTKAFGATNTPHVYVLNKSKKGYKVSYIGAIDDNIRDANLAKNRYVENAVDALLKGETVPTVTTKAIGCTIKWKTT